MVSRLTPPGIGRRLPQCTASRVLPGPHPILSVLGEAGDGRGVARHAKCLQWVLPPAPRLGIAAAAALAAAAAAALGGLCRLRVACHLRMDERVGAWMAVDNNGLGLEGPASCQAVTAGSWLRSCRLHTGSCRVPPVFAATRPAQAAAALALPILGRPGATYRTCQCTHTTAHRSCYDDHNSVSESVQHVSDSEHVPNSPCLVYSAAAAHLGIGDCPHGRRGAGGPADGTLLLRQRRRPRPEGRRPARVWPVVRHVPAGRG